MSETSTGKDRQGLLDQLRGQKVEIPDLLPLYSHWPIATNPAQASIKATVDRILETYGVTAAIEAKLKNANLPLIISNWFPTATPSDLDSLTYFVCWMYVVDDAIIDQVSWPGKDSQESFDSAKAQIMSFVEVSLGLDRDDRLPPTVQPTLENVAIQSFNRVGQVLRQRYNTAQRKRFLQACQSTFDGYQIEQRLRVVGSLPRWLEYRRYREGSCCMLMCVAMIEFAAGLRLPDAIMDSLEMQQLWSLTTQVSWLVNDMVSAKKELREGFIENAVALLAVDSGSCQVGFEKTYRQEQEAIAAFDEVAGEVRLLVADLPQQRQLRRDLKVFIDGCKHICTGALTWSLTSPRYGLADLPRNEQGNRVFVVGE